MKHSLLTPEQASQKLASFARWAVESWAMALGKELPVKPKEPSAAPQPTGRETEEISDANSWVEKGGKLAELGRYEEALSCYDRALELDPQDT